MVKLVIYKLEEEENKTKQNIGLFKLKLCFWEGFEGFEDDDDDKDEDYRVEEDENELPDARQTTQQILASPASSQT